jgi:serine/threonine protein kinase
MSMEPPATLGEIIGGYRLDAVLGRGGMGWVYAATHVRLGRKSALKVLSPALVTSDDYVSRFLREARIVNDVRHPNIVDVFDFVESQAPRRVAYVMEHVNGPSLGEVLQSRRLSARQAINVTLQLLSALEAVHRIGVVHGDLKPDNVLLSGSLESDLSATPSIKVLDFGIAHSFTGALRRRSSASPMLGTPAYMAPEQIASHPMSPATDLYAVGELLHELVTGQRLFVGERAQILTAKLRGEQPPLHVPQDVSGADDLARLLRWMLALDPADRPTSADVVYELELLLATQPEAQSALQVRSAPRVVAAPREPAESLASGPAGRSGPRRGRAGVGFELAAGALGLASAVVASRALPARHTPDKAQLALASASVAAGTPLPSGACAPCLSGSDPAELEPR